MLEGVRNADTLVVDSTFLEHDAGKAAERGHLTAAQAARPACTANVHALYRPTPLAAGSRPRSGLNAEPERTLIPARVPQVELAPHRAISRMRKKVAGWG
jgi:hypothetical protein